MSTKPDDSVLFFSHFHPQQYTTLHRANSPTMSEAMTSEDDPSLSVCKTRDISPKQDGQVNGVVSSSDETRHTSGASTTQEPAKKPEIALYFLQASRSIRIAWLLEELGMEYKVVFYNREKSLAAPEEFKEVSGGTMGKAPVLKDGNLILEESGAITQYALPLNPPSTFNCTRSWTRQR